MSYDLQVYAPRAVEQVPESDGVTVDGPLRVEREDLPPAVLDRAVGITVVYELSGQERASRMLARALADGGGVVYDPQEDAITWPRGNARRFTPPAAQRIDLLECTWYIRREDMPDDLPERFLAALETWAPEALPRRFGGFEPLQHTLAEEGAAGFGRAWRAETMMLHWKTTRPFLGGCAFTAGDEPLGSQWWPEHPVGGVQMSIDTRALEDHRWRTDVEGLFLRLAERLSAFCAIAVVERGWGYGGGSLWADAQTESRPFLTDRNARWLGLPSYPAWLTWCGPVLRQETGFEFRRLDSALE